MTDDLVNRLRLIGEKRLQCTACYKFIDTADEAADHIEKLEEQAHYANGVADLAMKHRDYAEQRVEKLEAALRQIAWQRYGNCLNAIDNYNALQTAAKQALEGKDD